MLTVFAVERLDLHCIISRFIECLHLSCFFSGVTFFFGGAVMIVVMVVATWTRCQDQDGVCCRDGKTVVVAVNVNDCL